MGDMPGSMVRCSTINKGTSGFPKREQGNQHQKLGDIDRRAVGNHEIEQERRIPLMLKIICCGS